MIKSIDCNKLIVKLLDPEFPVIDLDAVVDLIAACSVDVDSVEHGYWRDGKVRGSCAPLCSECGCDTGVNYDFAYCPTCGAKMDLPKESS